MGIMLTLRREEKGLLSKWNSFKKIIFAYLTSNRGSSGRLITSDHNNFNTSRSAFENSIRHTGLRRVDQRNKTAERKPSEFEVEISRACDVEDCRVEREFLTEKMELSETKNSFTFLTETEINLVEFGVPFLVNFRFTVSNENVRAVFPDSLGSTFHVNAVVTVTGLLFDDGEGEFDCRVEGHSCKLS